MCKYRIKGYNKIYHLRNKKNENELRGKWEMGEGETELEKREETKKPVFQHSTNILDHGTLFSNSTINTFKIPAFLRTEFGKTGVKYRKNIGDISF